MAAVAQLESNPQFASRRTGLTMTLPSNNLELAAAKGRFFMHRGLHLVESSIEIGRAMNEAIIFTFGLSGAGKSTTLNHLFGIKLAKVSDEEACTSDVSYFVSTMDSLSYELENLKIGFVDLPGWADGRGLSFQAQNMAIIEQFIAEHPHLGNRTRPCFPNVVLIIVNANDNRPKGPASQAVLMLKAIKHLHIIDRKRHNAVIVMTHVQSIPPNLIGKRKELYQGHCRAIFGFDPPFVYVENSYGEEGYNLPSDKDEDWTILSDGLNTKQPYNVFMALMEQMRSNYDEIGAEAVRIFFSSHNTYVPIITGCVDRSRVSKKSEQKWLQRVVHNTSELGRGSVISQMIEHDSAKLTKCHKQMLEPLMCELYSCHICDKADLENLDMAVVQHKVLPYVLQDFEMILLIRLFKVKPLDFPHLYQHIPSTCKIINNECLELITENFFTELPYSTHTSQGLLLPEFLEAQKYFQSEKRIISFTNQSSNAPYEEFEVDSLEKDFKITFHIKEILYRIYIELESIKTKFKLTEDFMHLITELPNIEDESNLNLEQYETFLEKYGHLVVTGSTCGGSIEGTMHFRMPEKEFNFFDYKYIIQECLKTLITTEEGSIELLRKSIPPNYSNLIDSLQRTKIRFSGGEAPLYCDSVENLTSQKYGIWLKSLDNNLIIVDRFDAENIQSISQMVHKINSEKGRALNTAMIRLNESIRVPTGSFCTPLNSLFEQSVEERGRGPSFLFTMSTHEITQIQQSRLNIGASLPIIQEKVDAQPNQQPGAPTTNQPISPILEQPRPQAVEDSPKTREAASSQAGNFSRAFLGFAGSSVVFIILDDKRFKRISLQNLSTQIESKQKPTDAVCYFLERDRRKMSRITFNPTSDTSKPHDFVVVIIKEGEIKMGYYQRIFRARMQKGKIHDSFVKAIDLNQGDHIYILNIQSRKLQITEIMGISSKIEIGCYHPKSDEYSLIVDLAVIPNECFPGNASVTLKGGEKVRMDEVKIGDYVLSIHPSTGKPVYSKVYLWAHRDPHITATFLHITHPHGHLHISANHLILSGEQRRPVPAGHLAVGDTIHSLLTPAATATAISVPVLHIHTCTQVGYYAPFTNNGLIVVDGIASSVYSQLSTRSHAHVCASVTGGLVEQFGMHRVGECVMAPVRVGCKLGVGSLILTKQMDTTTHIHKYCQWLMKITKV